MTELNNKINDLFKRLDEIKISHPNISSVWNNHLTIRHRKFVEEIERCNKMLDTITEKPDIPLEMIQLIITLMKGINNT